MPIGAPIHPVSHQARWHWLDALRGLALLGILVVNVQQMFFIKEFADGPLGISSAEPGVWSHWFLIHTLFDLKFLTLFTFLFGFSFVLQKNSIARKGAKLGGLYSRRLLALALIGILHATYLYYADVLFMYALAGFLLLACHKCTVRTLYQTGLILSAVGILLIFGLDGVALASKKPLVLAALVLVVAGLLARKLSIGKFSLAVAVALSSTVIFLQVTSGAAITSAADYTNLQNRAYTAYATDDRRPVLGGTQHEWPMSKTDLDQLELDADEENVLELLSFRKGPSALSIQYRLEKFFGLSVVGFILYFFWRIAGLFFLSAALASYGMEKIKDSSWAHIRTWSLILGAGFSIGSSAATTMNLVSTGIMIPFTSLLHDLSAYLVAAFFVAQFYLWRNRIAAFGVGRWLASGGRMALSNYIGQSAVMALIAGPAGLEMFGRLTHWQAFTLGILVFVILVTISHFWLKRFSMGPLEQLWRSATYLKWNAGKSSRSKDNPGVIS